MLRASATTESFLSLVARSAGRVLEVVFASAHGVHDGVEDAELTSSERADHDATGGEANGGKLDKADFLGDVHETSSGGTSASSASFVDLGQKRVGGMRDDGRDDTGNDA